MRNKTHIEQIERWGKFVKDNPDSWKKQHTEFVDSQFIMAERFFERLRNTPKGEGKIKKLRALKLAKTL